MNRAKPSPRPRLVEGRDLQHHATAPYIAGDHPGDAPTPAHPMVTYHCPHYPAGHVVPPHRHLRAQLLYAASGIMTVITEEGTWTVPPQQAVWIPSDVGHEVHMPVAVSMRSLYIHPSSVADLPADCKVVEVTPLLRELIARLEAGTLEDSTVHVMAMLLPVVMLLVLFMLFTVLMLTYAVMSNDKKYLAIIDRPGNTDKDPSA